MERGVKHLKAVARNKKIAPSDFQRTYKMREWKKIIYFLINRCSLSSDKRTNRSEVVKTIRQSANEKNILMTFQRIAEELRINLHMIQWEKNQTPQAAENHIQNEPVYLILIIKPEFVVLDCTTIYTCPPCRG